MRFTRHSGIYTLEVEQALPVSIQEAWDFLSHPANLARITPRHMGFEITSAPQEKMYEGQIITYRIGILPGIKTSWVTEITHIEAPHFFVDEQRSGPYKLWHHEHHLREASPKYVVMTDRLAFAMPIGLFRRAAYHLFVKQQLEKIFAYRKERLEELWGKAEE